MTKKTESDSDFLLKLAHDLYVHMNELEFPFYTSDVDRLRSIADEMVSITETREDGTVDAKASALNRQGDPMRELLAKFESLVIEIKQNEYLRVHHANRQWPDVEPIKAELEEVREEIIALARSDGESR